MLRRPHNKEGPPVFSHEFVIQNHADIVSCVCLIIFVGLIPQFSNQLVSGIIFVQYNMTVEPNISVDTPSARIDNKPLPEVYYQHGPLDLLNVVFYALVWIIIHALLQEYIWERTAKRLHLSKAKLAKYYDSGCLVAFFFLSLVWGIDYIIKENFLWDWEKLYDGYPHNYMRLSLKFYMLNQMAFWLHCYPELYFMKTKKDKMYNKIVLYTSSLLLIGGAYIVKLQRFALLLLVLHYSVDFLFHACRLLHYHNKDNIALSGFKLWRALFVLVRVLTVIIAILTLWFGLGKVHSDLKDTPPEDDVIGEGEEGEGQVEGKVPVELPDDMTKPIYRACALCFVLLLQMWVAGAFLRSQMDRAGPSGSSGDEPKPKPKTGAGKKKGQGEGKKSPKPKSS